ncbi:MAG: hypothetical protein EOO88_54075, partial [Pedobacter sp.]
MKTIMLMLLTCFIGSCQYTGKLTRRYKDMEIKSVDIKPWVQVNAYVNDPDKVTQAPVAPKMFADLSSEGQEELIKQLSKKVKFSDSLIYFIGRDLYKAKQEKEQPKILDNTLFTKRFIIGLQNKSDFPADRISKIEVTLESEDSNVLVISCDKIISKYESI